MKAEASRLAAGPAWQPASGAEGVKVASDPQKRVQSGAPMGQDAAMVPRDGSTADAAQLQRAMRSLVRLEMENADLTEEVARLKLALAKSQREHVRAVEAERANAAALRHADAKEMQRLQRALREVAATPSAATSSTRDAAAAETDGTVNPEVIRTKLKVRKRSTLVNTCSAHGAGAAAAVAGQAHAPGKVPDEMERSMWL